MLVFPTNGGVQVVDGLPSCFPGWGGGHPSTAPSPGFPGSLSDIGVPDVGFVDVFEVLVFVPGILLLVDELAAMLLPGKSWLLSPVVTT